MGSREGREECEGVEDTVACAVIQAENFRQPHQAKAISAGIPKNLP